MIIFGAVFACFIHSRSDSLLGPMVQGTVLRRGQRGYSMFLTPQEILFGFRYHSFNGLIEEFAHLNP